MKMSIAALILFGGCSSAYTLTTPPTEGQPTFAEFQKSVEGESVSITLKDSVVQGVIRQAREDSIVYEQWRVVDKRWLPVIQAVPFSSVSKVSFTSNLQGMNEFARAGGIAGSVVSVLIFSNFPRAEVSLPAVLLVGTIYGTLIGAPIGGVAGLIVGHKNEYRFEHGTQP